MGEQSTSGQKFLFAKLPLWQRELHAWKSDSHRVLRVTMPLRVSRELSLLREDRRPLGFAGMCKGSVRCA
jgi:hypothetical protein